METEQTVGQIFQLTQPLGYGAGGTVWSAVAAESDAWATHATLLEKLVPDVRGSHLAPNDSYSSPFAATSVAIKFVPREPMHEAVPYDERDVIAALGSKEPLPFYFKETKKALRGRTEYEVARSLMLLAAEVEELSPSQGKRHQSKSPTEARRSSTANNSSGDCSTTSANIVAIAAPTRSFLQYPRYLPRYHSFWHTDKHACYVMHHYTNGSLREALQRRVTLVTVAADMEPIILSNPQSLPTSLNLNQRTPQKRNATDALADSGTEEDELNANLSQSNHLSGLHSINVPALHPDDEDDGSDVSESLVASFALKRRNSSFAHAPLSGSQKIRSRTTSTDGNSGNFRNGQSDDYEVAGLAGLASPNLSQTLRHQSLTPVVLERDDISDPPSRSDNMHNELGEIIPPPSLKRVQAAGREVARSTSTTTKTAASQAIPITPQQLPPPTSTQKKSAKPRIEDEDVLKHTAAQILVALQFLHHHGVLYRDLKTENILVDSHGYVVLGDFDSCRAGSLERLWGHNKVSHTPPSASAQPPRQHQRQNSAPPHDSKPTPGGVGNIGAAMYDTGRPLRNLAASAKLASLLPPPQPSSAPMTNIPFEKQKRCTSLVGTVDYLCPEVIADAPIGPAVDSWGFGVLLFELATGTAPFRNSLATNVNAKAPAPDHRHTSNHSHGPPKESPHHLKLLAALPVATDKAVVRTIVEHGNKNGFTIKDAEAYRHLMRKCCQKLRSRSSSHEDEGSPLTMDSDVGDLDALHPQLFNATSFAAFTQQQLAVLATEISTTSKHSTNSTVAEGNAAAHNPNKVTGPVGMFRSFINSIFGDQTKEADPSQPTTKDTDLTSVTGSKGLSLVPITYSDLLESTSHTVSASNSIANLLPNGEIAAHLRMSPALLDLLQGLLHPHPNRRLSLEQCRAHPWWHYNNLASSSTQPVSGQSHGSCVFYNMYRYPEAPLMRYLRGEEPFETHCTQSSNGSRLDGALLRPQFSFEEPPKIAALHPQKAPTPQQEAWRAQLCEERIRLPVTSKDSQGTHVGSVPGTLAFLIDEELATLLIDPATEPEESVEDLLGVGKPSPEAAGGSVTADGELADDLGLLNPSTKNDSSSRGEGTNHLPFTEPSNGKLPLWQRPSL